MVRLNVVLLVLVVACALATVTAQHRARKSFVELERERERTQQLEIEFGQLQLEASTWATHGRIEKLATTRLNLRLPTPARVQVLAPPVEAPSR